jgi:hypothetical protein
MEQLKPPGALNLEGDLAENFKEWIQSFEFYLTATGIEEKAEKVQVVCRHKKMATTKLLYL